MDSRTRLPNGEYQPSFGVVFNITCKVILSLLVISAFFGVIGLYLLYLRSHNREFPKLGFGRK